MEDGSSPAAPTSLATLRQHDVKNHPTRFRTNTADL
jgi:hypothetical protein